MPALRGASGLLAAVALAPALASASLSDVFLNPRFARLELSPLAPVLADTVASTYPVASASSSVEFVYHADLDVIERRRGVLGPIIGERAETLGPGGFDISLSYSFVHLETINGDDLDDLVSARMIDGRFLFFEVPGGITLRDGRQTTILPVETTLAIDVAANVLAPSLTYGVTRDLDVNLTLPVLQTSLGVRTSTRVPDPRRPAFALPPGDPAVTTEIESESDASAGVGDLLLRAKYVVRRGAPVDIALGLGLSLPTGDADDFQGTGTTRVQPLLIASRRFGQRFELFLNAGADLNADQVDRSILRWATGATATVVERVAAAVTFLGRHELAAQSAPIRLPFFFQIERNDVYDASVGFRWQFVEAGVVSASAVVPMNRQGLRADVIPTVQVEYAF